MTIIYVSTHPNGRFHVGQTLTDSINSLAGAASELIAADATREQRRDLTIRRRILRGSRIPSDGDVRTNEAEFIKQNRANVLRFDCHQRPRSEE